MALELRCYAYRDGEAWEAICVDLDIATFAGTLDEVKESLAVCIDMYLERVAELPSEEQHGFLTRRSPWHLRIKLAVLTWLSGLRGDADRARYFTLQYHVPAFS